MSHGPIPPRQAQPRVRRIALPFLVLATTGAAVTLLVLFFRGSAPRTMAAQTASPVSRVSVADGWMTGLPDQPAPVEPPPKPLPPVDEDARRELRNLRKYLSDRDEQLNQTLTDLRDRLAKQQAPAPANPTPGRPPLPTAVKRPPMHFVAAERTAEAQPTEARYQTAPWTYIPCVVENVLNSEIEGLFTVRTTRPVWDATGQHPLIPQGQRVGAKDTSADLLFGNERIPTFALSLAMPDGSAVDLGEAPIMDASGTNGLTGVVNNHTWRLVWTSLFMGGLQGGQQVLQAEASSLPGGAIASGISRQGNSAAQMRLGRAQDTRPTIEVAAGETCQILVTKPLSLPAVALASR